MVRRAVACAVMILLSVSAPAQFPSQEGGRRDERMQQFITYEVVMLPGSDSLHTRVDIFYRVDRTFFIAVRNNDPAFPYPFVRRGEISLDRSEKDGLPQGRSVHRIEIGETSPETDVQAPHRWYTGAFSSEMPAGSFTVRFQVDDLESKRSVVEGPKKVDVPIFVGSAPADPLFLSPTADSLTLIPMNFGGDLLFGSGASVLVAWNKRRQGPVDVHYSFTLREPGGVGNVELSDSVLQLQPRTGYALVVRGDSGRAEFRLVRDSTSHLALMVVPFPAEKLPLRSFTLSVWFRDNDHLREIPKPFRMVWPDMPFSMKDVEYALNALRYIVTPGELDSLSSGGYEQERNNLERFWKSKDPTPGTAYNEMMTQYYRRVDYAIRSFSTLKQPDGSRTDRGRIYILYGPPTSIDRALDPSSGREIWTYSRLHRKYTFIDQSKNGTFILASTEAL